MHPAFSIIVFTTLSGLGYGLAAVLGLGLLDPAAVATKLAYMTALALIAGGLLSSTLHLGNPQRAWRALSQWRSSWLSREGVLSLLTFVPLIVSAWLSVVYGRYSAPFGIAATVLSLATVFCTSMIYACLKSVQAWHTRLTPACYLLFSLAGGSLLGAMFATAGGRGGIPLLLPALVFLIAAWAVKIAWLRNLDGLVPLSTPESATGLGAIGRVRLFERPHVTENYLTNEMGFRVARKHAEKLRRLALLLGGLLPGGLIFLVLAALMAGANAGLAATLTLAVAALSHVVGMFVERWLFFAEARHAVMNYYGG
ncbi:MULTISPECIES: dimethyl sulfoxide reductase anchor subunit family protein [Phyllobacteriaceae]|jgi:DMSO reductase anchor subunit|uniref:DMSO reductase n=1 Tax=Mesorhizobium hungaricum TaxID=1566387 RepID=A0A1C2DNE6_9HYPH|nr:MULTISPECIES: DmsC/YnfH family molybdoenzyme membrane anchor subunit [Mesorhizobium]MBN9233806.1 dimethyl sulfoxide reductase anchor subunit [Mesorhizobium sp.]MDQ0328385.1 DMSO reductase anchor subunit [Mesorhizobium sp. YL-MeA3-2017]OCX16298.1 DMSO reductase [Mesorhizobium hungaricum]